MKRIAISSGLLVVIVLAVIWGNNTSVSAAPALSSVSVTSSVTGGEDVTIKVTLSARATARTRVTLTSSNRAALPTPSSITVASGRSTASVTVESGAVARATTVTVAAKLGSASKTDSVKIQPPALASVSLPASIAGGYSLNGTVRLTGPAPSGGILVTLKTNRPSRLAVPASVRVGAGKTSASFALTASGSSVVDVTVTGTLGVAKTDTIKVDALRLTLDLKQGGTSPPAKTLYADVPVSGRVLLNGTVPASGAAVVVSLAAGFPTSAAPPASVTIRPGSSSAAFTFTPVLGEPDDIECWQLAAAVTGSPDLRTTTAGCTSVVSNITALTVAPAKRGATTTGTVRLARPYPTAVNVALTFSEPTVATGPTTVRISAGETQATFDVRLLKNGASRLTASYKSSRFGGAGVIVGISVGIDGDNVVYAKVTTRVCLRMLPVPYAVTLRLQSSDPSVIAVTRTTVTVPANTPIGSGGCRNISVPVEVKKPGTARISASYDGATFSLPFESRSNVNGISLVDPPVVGTVRAQLTLEQARSTSYSVTLSSSDPSVLTVPASVTVPARATWVNFSVRIVGSGSTRVAATYDGVTARFTVTTAVTSVASVSLPAAYVGVDTRGTVTLSDAATEDTVVELANTSSIDADVQELFVIPAGETTGEFVVRPYETGTLSIRATLDGYSRTASVTVREIVEDLTLPAEAVVGEPATVTVTLAAPVSQDLGIQLRSSNTVVVTVPASVTVPAGSGSAEFPITTVGAGTTRITLTFGSFELRRDLTVVQRLTVSTVDASPVYLGVPGSGRVITSATANADTVVQLASSHPAVATVPATTTVPAGSAVGPFAITPVGIGTTTITATLNGTSITYELTITSGFISDIASNTLHPLVDGQSLLIIFAGGVPQPLTLSASSDSAILTLPSSIAVAAETSSVSVPITVTGSGTVSVTITAGGISYVETFTVAPLLGNAYCAPCPVYEGQASTGVLQVNGFRSAALSVSVSSSDPAVASVASTVNVPGNESGVNFPITVGAPGTATITVSAAGESVSFDIEVRENTLSVWSPGQVAVGATDETASVRLVSPPAGDVVVTLTVSDPAVVGAPATVTIPAGSTSTTIPLTGLRAGSTTVTATWDGHTAQLGVTVVDP